MVNVAESSKVRLDQTDGSANGDLGSSPSRSTSSDKWGFSLEVKLINDGEK